MKLLETIRSWSFPPPAYDDGEQLHPLPQRQSAQQSHLQISRWLLTFEKQWLLVHVLASFSCFALMFTGAALFVTTTFDNFDEGHPAWLGSVVGMLSLVTSGITFGKLTQAYRPDPSKTPEQLSTNKFICTAVGVLGQAFIGVVVLSVAFNLPIASQYGTIPSFRMRLEQRVAIVAATFCFVAAAYDMVRLCLDGRDDYYDEDNLLGDAIERDTNVGSVRLD